MFAAFASTLRAAEMPNDGVTVSDWLQARTAAAAASWRTAFEACLASGAWAERNARQRAFLLKAIGGLPATRGDLDAKVHAVRSMEGYRIEAVRYASQPGFIVTANLYLPNAASAAHPVPGVLIPCGHAQVAKAFEEYQAAAALLALNGIAALIYDPLDQGERIQRFTADGEVISDGVNAHLQEGMAALLLGRNLARVMIWDGIRSLDYLASRPEIDAARLAVTGHSGGGTLTALLFALDPRLKAAAPCCYLSEAHHELWHNATAGAIDSEQLLFGQLAQGFEHADFFLTRPPAPVLLLAATRDTNDITRTWATFRALKRAFTSQGADEQVAIVEDDVPHSYSRKHREAMVAWMLRWLHGEDRPVREPEIALLAERELFATPEGQVLRLPGARSIWDLFRDEAAQVARERGHPSGAELRRRIRRVTGIDDRPAAPRIEVAAAGEAPPGYTAERLRLHRSDRSVPVELVSWKPHTRDSDSRLHPLLLFTPWNPAPDAPSLATCVRERRTIAIGRAFGMNETPATPDDMALADDAGSLTNAEWAALYELGESPVRHRAEDILLVARHLVANASAVDGQLELVAEGVMAVPALHAAVLAPELFASVTVRRAPARWEEFFTLERSYGMNDSFVHGVLRQYDLPDLVNALGRRLRIEQPVNLLNLAADDDASHDPAYDDPSRPGLAGVLFGGGDLRNPREVDVLHETRDSWTGRGMSWSAEWRGFLTGPIDGEVEFEGTTNRQIELIIDGTVVLPRSAFPGTTRARLTLSAGKPVPIILRFTQSEGHEASMALQWSWPGHPPSPISGRHLRHSRRQLDACRIAVRR